MTNLDPIDPKTRKKIDQWLTGPFDAKTKQKVQHLHNTDIETLIDAFHCDLSFGTGGMRGLMGIGTNRINIYTLSIAMQGFSNYLHKEYSTPCIVIGYDSRINSKLFAEKAAEVLSSNQIKVLLCSDLRPTPFVSFACRYSNSHGAIMITASHNPPEYNGFKIYGDDGGQVISPQADKIVECVRKITDITEVKSGDTSNTSFLPKEVDAAYLDAVYSASINKNNNELHGGKLKIVFSNLHGTGITLLPKALQKCGFSDVEIVKSQEKPDGSFPTTNTPNPELLSALQEGLNLLASCQGDILLSTDPDADRLGVALIHNKEQVILTGNQIAVICVHHLAKFYAKEKTPNGVFITSIVSSKLQKKIAQAYGHQYIEVLTGFKYIAEKIRQFENTNQKFLFGTEESHGYLNGTYARDKDGISAACLVAEIALVQKLKNKDLVDYLYAIFEEYGVFLENTHSISFPPGKKGSETIKESLKKLRSEAPSHIGNLKVIKIDDYLLDLNTDLPKANVIAYQLDDGSSAIIRPSGTEPKIKIYTLCMQKEFTDVKMGIKLAKQKIEKIQSDLINTYFSSKA